MGTNLMLAISEFVDGNTLVIVNIVLSAVSALVMFCLRISSSNAKGLISWALSNALFALGFLMLMSYYIHWPDILNAMVANLLIDGGAILAYVAVLQFLERPKSDLWLIAPTVLLCAIELTLFLIHGTDMGMMVLLGALARAIVTIGAGWQLWRHADPYLRPASTISAIFHFLWAGMLFTRIGWWISSQYHPMDWDPTTSYALMVRIVLTFVVTPSYLWMVTRQLDRKLLEQARQDPLTGIANRRVMWDCGQRAMGVARQKETKSVSLLMIDVDHFKSVNDRFGHGVGDQVLVGIAGILTEQIRDRDIVARVGGEEFMVLLPETEQEAAMTVADRLRSAVEQAPFPLEDGRTLFCTISIGLSLFDQDAENWDGLVLAADQALYCAKRLGRNRIETPPPVEAAVTAAYS